MTLKNTERNLISIPMGISVVIHILLVISLSSIAWENSVSKPETPPIRIKYVASEPKKVQKNIVPQHKTAKPAKGNPKPLKPPKPIKLSKPFQPVQQRTVYKNFSRSPISPAEISAHMHIQSAAMVSNSTQPVPISTSRSKNPPLMDFSPVQSSPIHTSRRAFSGIIFRTRPIQPSIGGLTNPSARAATKILATSGRSYSKLRKEVTPKAFSEELNFALQKASPTPSLKMVERWIPDFKSHPVKLASIPSEFFDENLKSTSQAFTNENNGNPAGETDSSGQDLNAIRKGYSSIVWRKITKAKYYPSKARKRGWEGNPIVEFKLARNGDLLSSIIAHTSPYKILDEAALNAVKNAVPYPQIPEKLKLDSIRFKLPISFILDEP